MGASHGKMLLAMVLLNQPHFPAAEQVAERLTARCGDRYYPTWEEAAGKDSISLQSYQVNNQRIDLMLMPAPIPWTELEGPCATNRFWPEATAVCREHRAHLIVTLRSDWEDPIRKHLLLTDFIAAIVEAVEAPAVYWGAGGVVQPAHLFCQWAAGAGPDDLPLFLWADFRLFPHEGAPFVATSGLAAFRVMEIEGGSRRLKPMELVGKVFDIAHYTCTRGPVLNDGDTIGESDQERIRIRHAKSVWDRPGPVIRIEFDGEKRPGGFFARLFNR